MTNSLLSFVVSNGLAASAMAVVVWLVTRKFKSPPLAHALWLLVLVKLISPPLFDVPLPSLRMPDEPATAVILVPNSDTADENLDRLSSEIDGLRPQGRESISVSDLSASTDNLVRSTPASIELELDEAVEVSLLKLTTSNQAERSWPDLLCIVWATGTVLWLVIAVFRIVRFRNLLTKTQPAKAALQVEVQQLAAEIGLRRTPEVRVAASAAPPLTWALWGRPVMLLPQELLHELSDAERHTLLAHELAHLMRRDHLVRWLELLAIGLNWWQPVAWYAQRQLHNAGEQCCDAWVVGRFPHLARAYAETLLKTVDFLADAKPTLPIGGTGFGQAHQLKRRFEMILYERKNDRLTWLVRLMLVAIGCVVLPMSMQSLWAETPRPVAEVASPTDSDSSAALAAASDAEPAPTPTSANAPTTEERLQCLEGDLKTLVKTLGSQQMQTHDVLKKIMLELDSIKARDGKSLGEAQPSVTSQNSRTAPGAAANPPPTVERRLQSLEKDIKSLVQVLESREKRTQETIKKLLLEIDSVKSGSGNVPPKAERQSSQQESAVPPTPTKLQQLKNDATLQHQELVDARESAFAFAADAELVFRHNLVDLKRDFTTKMSLSETNFNRMIAATKQVEAVQAAYDAGTVSLDLLLDAQRRECDAEINYRQSILDIINLGKEPPKQVANQIKLPALKQGRARALETWKKEHAAMVGGQKGGERDKEAQARGQYLYFRDEIEKVLKSQDDE